MCLCVRKKDKERMVVQLLRMCVYNSCMCVLMFVRVSTLVFNTNGEVVVDLVLKWNWLRPRK